MRRILRSALRDLDEAVLWLRQPNVDRRPGVLTIPVLAVSTAEAKLEQVQRAIDAYGPGAEKIPE
ncbi:MAG: hypothetical protein AB7P22_14875 [Vicinamibacterales bacterium]